MRECNQCHELKDETEFTKRKDCLDGLRKVCKDCRHKNSKEYYLDNKEEIDAKHRIYSVENKDKRKTYYEKYRNEHKDDMKKWRLNNKHFILNQNKNYTRNKRKTDPKFLIIERLRCNISRAFRLYSKNGKTKSSKQYGIDFNAIFEKVGPRPGTGKEWHLDHIIPISIFNLDNPEHVRLAHLPCNLQWLPGLENIHKSDDILNYVYDDPELVYILNIIFGYYE